MSSAEAPPNTPPFSPEQWEDWWAQGEAEFPERGYLLNWCLPWFRQHFLTNVYRSAVAIVQSNARRMAERERGRFSPY